MSQSRIILAVGCLVFLALGLVTGSIGTILGEVSVNTLTPLEAIGALYTALFLGTITSQIASGYIHDRLGARFLLLGGLMLNVAGVSGYTTSQSFYLMLFFGFLSGLGFGALLMSIQMMISVTFPDLRVRYLSLINTFFGIGAIIGPLIGSQTIVLYQTARPPLWLGALVMFAVIPITWFLITPQRPQLNTVQTDQTISMQSLFFSPWVWIFGLLFLLYIGIENGVGGWTSEYLELTLRLSEANAAQVISAFWATFTIGRALNTAVSARLSPPVILFACFIGALCATLLLGASQGNQTLTFGAILLMGLSFGPIYPTTFGYLTLLFPKSAAKAASIATGIGSLGGATLTAQQGTVLVNLGPASNNLYLIAIAISMLVIFAIIQFGQTRQQTQVA
ncbi:MAG: MFS transporter [Anaerolineae bacterium]|jgi:fucose permease|nr:MFS transporter [Anaerolineae bacterium]